MYPYFQARFKNGRATHIVEVHVSDEQFKDLIQEKFGITSEELFDEENSYDLARNARELYEFLRFKNIKFRVSAVR